MPRSALALALAFAGVAALFGAEHRVRKGETLSEIAASYGVSVRAVKTANNLANADSLSIGQTLQMPVQTKPRSYTVRRGDILSEIAKKFGVSLRSLKDANAIRNANRIKAGQVLAIPASSAPPAQGPVPEASRYKVQRGDALSDIAQKFGVSVEAIKASNDIADPDKISIGQTLLIPGTQPSTIDYVVKRGDILSGIAKVHGVPMAAIKNANTLRNANRLRVGQVLKIPVPAGQAPPAAASGPRLDPGDLKQLSSIRRKRDQWRHIVIHHSASPAGSAKSFDRFHRDERGMENGLAYHFVIGNGRGMRDGELAIGDRWRKQMHGGHLTSYALNQISIGICLVGDFSKGPPSQKQMRTLEALVRYLMEKVGVPLPRVTTHTLIHPKHTLCPGKHFPFEALRAALED